MTPIEQKTDNMLQIEYLTEMSKFFGYAGIHDLVFNDLELFDAIAENYRVQHQPTPTTKNNEEYNTRSPHQTTSMPTTRQQR